MDNMLRIFSCANRIPIIESGKVIGAIGTVMFKNIEDINILHKRLSSMKRELDKYKDRLRQENSTKYSFDDIKGKSEAKNLYIDPLLQVLII